MKDLELAKEITGALERNDRTFPNRLSSMLHLKLADCSREEAYIDYEFEMQDWVKNSYDGIHGGIVCSIFDTCIGFGAVALSRHHVSTTDMSVSFLRGMTGESFLFHIEYPQIGKRMIRGIGKAIDKKTGAVCATAQASFLYVGDLVESEWK